MLYKKREQSSKNRSKNRTRFIFSFTKTHSPKQNQKTLIYTTQNYSFFYEKLPQILGGFHRQTNFSRLKAQQKQAMGGKTILKQKKHILDPRKK